MESNKTIIRVRGVIMHEGKFLVVAMPQNNYYCLPGGKLEFSEDIKECLSRELIEELGVKPEIGKLLYVNNFTKNEVHNIDFIFEVKNGSEYIDCEKLERTHAYELSDIYWANQNEDIKILPLLLKQDFENGNLLSDEVKFINR